MAEFEAIPEVLLQRARDGDAAARDRLLELYRNYLRVLARTLIGQALQVRLDASDLVQETYLKAHREFARFLGGDERELVGWLRQILVRTLADEAKKHRRLGRDLGRQESLEAALDRSCAAVHRALTDPLTSPSGRAERREQCVFLADALEKLPADYREVFILRSLEHVPVEQIAAQMGRSANAIYKLWFRAMATLRRELEGLT